ncbi:MAG: hypothetical protein WAO08_03630, partial [Hyphomicrobiaceae bacterium]
HEIGRSLPIQLQVMGEGAPADLLALLDPIPTGGAEVAARVGILLRATLDPLLSQPARRV